MPISDDNGRIVSIVPKELVEKITNLATEEKRSVSAMAAILLEEGYKNHKK